MLSIDSLRLELSHLLSYYGYNHVSIIMKPFRPDYLIKAYILNGEYHIFALSMQMLSYHKNNTRPLYKKILDTFPNYYGLSKEVLDIATMGEAFKKELD